MKTKFIILLLIIFVNQLLPQNKENIIAKVGNKIITEKEFEYRYELTPQVNRKYNNNLKSKEEFLYTLIAENLFALQAEKLGYDTLKDFKTTYIPLEKMFVRDALYKEEIKNKVAINKNKLSEGLKLANKKYFVDYLYTTNEKKIKAVYQTLKNHNNFDSLATLFGNDVEYIGKPYEVTFGKMKEDAEGAIFSLNLNEFTKPVQSPEGWYIFRLLKIEPVIYKSSAEKFSLVKKVVEERAEDSVFNNYWQEFFKKKKIKTNASLFWYFAEKLQTIIEQIKEKQKIQNGKKITVTAEDFLNLQKSLAPDSLKETFIYIPGNPVSLEDFLNDFMFEGFFTFTTNIKTVSMQLNSRVKRQIELELLAEEGYKKGLESLPGVKKETEIWKKNYLATLFRQNFVNKTKLTDNDIKNYITKNKKERFKETEVNIIEITVNNLEEIEQILKQEKSGIDFKEIAKKYTNKKKVETGYFPVSENKEIGTIAETMNPGDVYGPVKTGKGYTVFKLLEKKESNLPVEISQLDEETKRKIRYKKVLESLENKTVELAEKYNVTINKKLLDSIKLKNAQMIVFRYMGFGGRILAFPISVPFYQWKEKWEQKKKESL